MKIAIVNDSPLSVEAIEHVLAGTDKYTVAWAAGAGADAVAMCESDRPDLLLMDLTTRGMDGVVAIRRIMAATPCAILIVTNTIEANSARIFNAMDAGALDAVQTPGLDGADGVANFLNKLHSVACIIGRGPHSNSTNGAGKRAQCAKHLVAIGSSAGGPAALASVLGELPADLGAAVVVVQHIDAQFAPGLAKWLGDHCKMPVQTAASGDTPIAGTVYLAATNDHLVLESSTRLGYTRNPVDYSYRPSVNAFFESSARHWRGSVVGVLLTGMGSDGAKGLKMLRNLGHHTIAQDQQTSAVYGMPRAAADLQAAAEILPLDRIANAIGRRFQNTKNGAALKHQ